MTSLYQLSNTSSPEPPQPIDPAFNLTMDPDIKLILLLTSFRGGSTFMGKIFDVNPAVQYLFEPFYDVAVREYFSRGQILGARADHTEADLRMLYLQQILHNCTVYNSWFPEQYEWCGSPEENLIRYNSTQCEKRFYRPNKTPKEICNLRKIIVLKVIRQQHLSDILKIAQIRTANIKIIHLLRHPIPLMMSRGTGGKYFGWDRRTQVENGVDLWGRRVKSSWETYNYCAYNLESVKLAGRDPWLSRAFMTVSHREMSLEPLKTTERIYNFVEEKLTVEIKEYILNMTNADAQSNQNNRHDGLDTFKNSTKAVNAWKELRNHWVKFWDLYSVESQCKLLIGMLKEGFTVDNISYKKLRYLHL